MRTAALIKSLTIIFMAALVACTPQEDGEPPDEITVQLKWVHQAQFAGFYVAREEGFCAAERLNVQFIEGGQTVDIAQSVITGAADFGVMSPEDILIKRSQGAPLTAIAAIYRRSAVVYVSMADSGIIRPFDFKDKTVAIKGTSGTVRDFEFQFYAMMKMLELDLSRITLVPYDSEYTGFYSGDVDVTGAYLTGGVTRMRQEGHRVNLILPSDYGVHFYSDTLVATEETISRKQELVTRFLRATLKGWREAIGDTRMAVADTLKYARDKDIELQTAMMDSLIPLVHTGEDRIGWMRASDWRRMHQVLFEQKIISKPVDIGKAYTTAFLEAIYGAKKP